MDQENIPDSTNASNSTMAKPANISSDSLFVPNWLVEVFEWIKRSELINSPLNTASRIFHRICWLKLHGNVPPRRLPHLLITCYAAASNQPQQAKLLNMEAPRTIKDGYDRLRGIIWTSAPIPIPSIRPPDYFIRITKITIKFLNEQTLEFLKTIAHLLEKCNLIFTNNFQISGWENEEQRTKLMSEFLVFMASKMCILELPVFTTMFFRNFYRLHPNIFDTVERFYVNAFEHDEILFDWVAKPHCEGKQKILFSKLNIPERMKGIINRIKKEFRTSTRPANFIISAYDCAKFRMENDRTGEVLELYEKLKNSAARYLVRYPKGEEEYWKKIGQNKIEKMPDTCHWYSDGIEIF